MEACRSVPARLQPDSQASCHGNPCQIHVARDTSGAQVARKWRTSRKPWTGMPRMRTNSSKLPIALGAPAQSSHAMCPEQSSAWSRSIKL